MRLRIVVLACALTSLGGVAAPSVASAAPRHNHHLTIAAIPNPVPAGEGVLIYGRLLGAGSAGQTIRLYHHLVGSGRGYTRIGTAATDQSGFYEFTRAEGVVETNRDWFVRGPDRSHSRTVDEFAMALVSINSSGTSTDTNHPVVFTGTVKPNHAFERVILQQQVGSSDEWQTLKSGRLDAGSNYTIPYRWRRPGVRDVRVLFKGDPRNLRGASDVATVIVQQAQVPDFTINSSSPITPFMTSVTISGTLDEPGRNMPEPNTVVQLWGRTARSGNFIVLADTPTGPDGGYSFTELGVTTNTVYFVATMRLPGSKRRQTARLFQGVQDALTLQSSASTATAGETVTFAGTVLPDKAGELVYLQKFGKDAIWHTVGIGTVRHDSTFAFQWTFGAPGTHTFRARMTSDGLNVGSHSQPVSVTVTAPPASSLPPAS